MVARWIATSQLPSQSNETLSLCGWMSQTCAGLMRVLFPLQQSCSQAAGLNNDQHIWLMSAVCSSWGEGFRLSLPLCVACDERTPFTVLMMIDIIRSQVFHSSLHTSWSLTSGISKMNGLSLSGTGEVIFSSGHVKAPIKNMKIIITRKEIGQRKQQLNSDCQKHYRSFFMFVILVML